MWRQNKNLKNLFFIASFAIVGLFTLPLLTSTAQASTGVSPDISFEGKIVNSSGVNITNGTYNVEFTMYTGCTNEPTNNTGCTLAWTEDYLTSSSQGVAINGGTFEVNLGQYCAFSGSTCQGNTNTGINWNTYPIYMSMQIGGTANCTSSPAGGLFTANCAGDGVMQPYILMTSTPYAQNAGTLGNIAASGFGQLAIGSQTWTGSNTFEDSTNSATAFQVDNNGAKTILGVDTSGNQVVFGNATTNVGQVVFDDGTNSNAVTLNVGTTTAAYSLTLPTVAPTTSQCLQSGASTAGLLVFGSCSGGSYINNGTTLQSSASFDIQATSSHVTGVLEANGADILDLKNSGAVNVASFGSTGADVFENSTNSTTAFQVQTSAAANILNIDTTNSIVDVGALAPPLSLSAVQAPIAGTPTGTAGPANYTYEITAVSANGAESLGTTEVANSFASNINANPLTINWTTNGASFYRIYRTASTGANTSTGLVGTSTTGSFIDYSYSGGVSAPPLATSGTLGTPPATFYYEVTALDNTYTTGGSIGQSTPSTQLTATTNAVNKSLTISWVPVNGARAYNVYRTTTTGVYTTDSYYTVYTNSFTDTGGTATGTNVVPPTVNTGYGNNLGNNANANVTIGDNGTETGQLYVGGSVPTTALSTTLTGTNPKALYVQGNYAYVVNYGANTLQIFDISNPSAPVSVSSVTTNNGPQAVSVQGNYAYIVNYTAGTLQVIDVSNPTIPFVIATNSSIQLNLPSDIVVSGIYAYVTDGGDNGLQIFDISDPTNPVSVSFVPTAGDPFGVYVQGDYAYVTLASQSAFQVVNISNPYSPYLVGTATVSTQPISVYVQGKYAYVLSNSASTLQVFDITNPVSPTIVGTVTTLGGGYNVVVQGRYAYVDDYTGNLFQVFDVSNPADPTSINSVATGTAPRGLAVVGRYAYVASYTSGTLQVFDLGGAYVQQLQAGGAEVGTLVVDTSAQVNGSEDIAGGLQVGSSVEVDGNVAALGNLNISGSTQLLGTTGLASVYGGYTSSNLNAPTLYTPTFSGTSGGTAASWSYQVEAVDASGNTTAVSNTGTISSGDSLGLGIFADQTVSSTTFASPHVTYNVPSGQPFIVGMEIDVTSCSGTAADNGSYTITSETTSTIVVSNASGVAGETGCNINSVNNYNNLSWSAVPGAVNYYVFRTAVPGGGTPTTTGYIGSTPSTALTDFGQAGTATYLAQGTDATGNYIFASSSGVTALNINTANPAAAGSVVTGTNPYSVYVQGNYAYVANYGSASLQVINVSNPSSPVVVGTVTTGTNPVSVYAQGNYAYVVNYSSASLQVINVSNPSSPVVVGTVTTGTSPYSVYVQGSYAYVVNYNSASLQVINVSNPSSPVVVGTVTTGTNPDSVYVRDNYAYVANLGSVSLQVINVSNPSSPVVVGSVTTAAQPISVYVQGNYAYVADDSGASLQVINVSNPSSPVVVGTVATGGNPWSVYVQGNYAYVANAGSGTLQVINISSPSTPTVIDNITVGTDPYSVYVQGNYAYVVNYGSPSLQVINLSGAYAQQLQVGGAEVGTLQVDSDADVEGDASINGGLVVGGSSSVTGNSGTGGLTITGALTTPATPTETVTCSGTCTSSYSYAVAAANSSGTSAVSPNISTAVANATLNTTTEYNETSWSAVTGATSYNVYRTAGGAAQGLIGAVNYTSVLTPSSGSETGTVLTLNFASPPPWTVGQAVTLSAGFVMSAGTIAGLTLPITAETATSITLNHIGGVTGTVTTEGTVTGDLAFFDTAQTAGSAAPTTATAGVLSSAAGTALTITGNATSVWSLSAGSLTLQTASGNNIILQPGTATVTANVQIGAGNGGAGSTTPDLLVLDDNSSGTDPTEVNGAMYYNASTGNFRCGVAGSWENCIGGLLTSSSPQSAQASCTTACGAIATGTSMFPANYCVAGRVIHIIATGVYSSTATSPTLALSVYLGTNAAKASDTLLGAAGTAATAGAATAQTNDGWSLDVYLYCVSSTSVWVQGGTELLTSTAGATFRSQISATAATTITNTTQNLYIFPAWSANSATNTITCDEFIIQGM